MIHKKSLICSLIVFAAVSYLHAKDEEKKPSNQSTLQIAKAHILSKSSVATGLAAIAKTEFPQEGEDIIEEEIYAFSKWLGVGWLKSILVGLSDGLALKEPSLYFYAIRGTHKMFMQAATPVIHKLRSHEDKEIIKQYPYASTASTISLVGTSVGLSLLTNQSCVRDKFIIPTTRVVKRLYKALPPWARNIISQCDVKISPNGLRVNYNVIAPDGKTYSITEEELPAGVVTPGDIEMTEGLMKDALCLAFHWGVAERVIGGVTKYFSDVDEAATAAVNGFGAAQSERPSTNRQNVLSALADGQVPSVTTSQTLLQQLDDQVKEDALQKKEDPSAIGLHNGQFNPTQSWGVFFAGSNQKQT
jgi:hypothetical protein